MRTVPAFHTNYQLVTKNKLRSRTMHSYNDGARTATHYIRHNYYPRSLHHLTVSKCHFCNISAIWRRFIENVRLLSDRARVYDRYPADYLIAGAASLAGRGTALVFVAGTMFVGSRHRRLATVRSDGLQRVSIQKFVMTWRRQHSTRLMKSCRTLWDQVLCTARFLRRVFRPLWSRISFFTTKSEVLFQQFRHSSIQTQTTPTSNNFQKHRRTYIYAWKC